MDTSTLQFLLYIIYIIGMFGYAALDGFDLGVGCLHLFAKSDKDRRIILNSIGPIWDSNALWIIITAGTLFAGFPNAFAHLLSSLYLLMMLTIFCFVARSAAIEFRSKMENTTWRKLWDTVFFSSSMILCLGYGILIANLLIGLPTTKDGQLLHSIFSLFHPYALYVGLFTALLFTLHGALYLNMKTEGDLHRNVQRWIRNIYTAFVPVWIGLHLYSFQIQPIILVHVLEKPMLWIFGILNASSLILIPYFLKKKWDGWAFLSNFLMIGTLIASFALGTFPNIIRSSVEPEINNITIYNSSATNLTLQVILSIAIIGMPLFLFYLCYTYRVFRGKVQLDTKSY